MSKCKGEGCEAEAQTSTGYCNNCLADIWGKIVDRHPMISPQSLMRADGRLPE